MASSKKPLIIKDVVLMSPGLWNETNYEAEELRKAYLATDWGNTHATSLFLDHPENPNNAAGDWIGRVKNPRQLEDSTIIGDIEVWDEDTAFKMEVAKAGFGVSPRVLGNLDKSNNSFVDFIFDNFSIVSKPAQNTATINLTKEIFSEGLMVRKLSRDEDLSIHPKKKSKKMKGGKREMNEEETKNTETAEEVKGEEAKEEPAKEEKPSEEGSEEPSDAETLSMISNDLEGFNEYAKGIRAENPSISLNELAKKYKVHKERYNFLEELSETEATIMLKKLLGKIGIEDKAKVTPNVSPAVKEMASELNSLKKQVKELSAPKSIPKSVKSATRSDSHVSFNMVSKEPSEGVKELAQHFLNLR